MKPLKLPLLLCALAAAGPAAAQVYKQVDPSGRVIYTDKPAEGAQKLDLPPVTTVPAVKPPAKDQPAGNAAEGGPAPRSDAARKEAKARLEEAERRLEAARKELSEQEQVRLGGEATNYQKYLDRVQPYKDAVARQQLEVEQLRKEAGQ